MIPALIVFAYLGVVLYIGVFAFRGARGAGAEDYFLAGRALGPAVFLLSLFGTNMTAFTILGSAGHAFANGILTFGLMASSSALIRLSLPPCSSSGRGCGRSAGATASSHLCRCSGTGGSAAISGPRSLPCRLPCSCPISSLA